MANELALALRGFDERDINLVASPLSHAAVLMGWPLIAVGATQVVMPAFDPGRFLELVERERATCTFLAPTMVQVAVNHPDALKRDLNSLRFVFYAASPIAERTLLDAMKVWGNINWQLYGQSEVLPVTVMTPEHRPVEGSRYAGALKAPVSYQRIGRTVDLTGVPATGAPTLRMKLSYSTLQTFHHVIVEAAPSGTDDWTTLRDLNGRTSSGPPTTCAQGFLLPLHPFLSHYLSPGRSCGATGTTGSWNAFTGESGGWVDAAFDLSRYAGRRVDVKVSYITDAVDVGVGGGIGVFVDDTRLTVNGTVVESDGFEAYGGAWAVEGPPPGSPPSFHGNFTIGGELIPVAASVATDDTALLGFGIESLATPAERADVLGRVIKPLLPR